jgi:hypothetical protein
LILRVLLSLIRDGEFSVVLLGFREITQIICIALQYNFIGLVSVLDLLMRERIWNYNFVTPAC